ncbi:MAG: hypothetical protein PHX83_01230 [Acidobacteriia bacterium]|nr:hypothetical protein [Terriglobia bacterium]
MEVKLVLIFCKEACLPQAREILKKYDVQVDIELGHVLETLSTRSRQVEEWPGYSTILMTIAPLNIVNPLTQDLARFREQMHPSVQQGVKILVLNIEKEV